MMNPQKAARTVIKRNTGDHILLGPALLYEGRYGMVLIHGGDPDPVITFVRLHGATDVDSARSLRTEICAELIWRLTQKKASPGIVIHDCGDEEQLAHLARAAYPCEKIESITRKILKQVH